MSAPRPLGHSLVSLAAAALSLLAGCGELATSPAVRLGDRTLGIEDLRTAYADLEPAARPPLATREDRRAFARRVVERMLLVEAGSKLASADPAGAGSPAPDVSVFMLRRLRVVEAGGAGIDSAAVARAWERMQFRHRVQVLFFGTEEEARAARGRLDAGESFESLRALGAGADEQDTWVTWTPSSEPVADAVADLEAGETAGPVRVGGGWLLVRVIERTPFDAGSRDEARPRILQGLRVRREIEALEALAGRLRTEADVRLEEKTIRLLADRTREAIVRPGAAEQDPDWAIPRISTEEESVLVAEWTGGNLEAGEYVRRVTDEGRAQRPRVALASEVRRAVDQMVTTRLLLAEADRRGLGRDWWVQRAVRRAREERAVQRAILEIERLTPPSASSADSLAELLHATQPGLFRLDARLRVLRFDTASRADAEAELVRIRREGGPEIRLRELLDRERANAPSYHLFWITPAELPSPEVFEALYEGGPGTLTGPHRLGDLWVVFACLERKPPSQPTREEILARLRSAAPGGTDPRRIAAWVEEQTQARGLVIDDDVLDALAPGG